jgi:AcrR family transcriptional regulator
MISYYFGSKEKLFEKIFEFRMNESLSFAKDVLADQKMNEWEKLTMVIDRYIDRVKNLKTFYLIMQREQLTNKNEHIVKVLNESKKGFLEIYKKLIESGIEKKVFTRKPRLEFLHSTISGTIFSALHSLPIYKNFYKGDEKYENLYFEELNNHIKNVIKYLLGYEENK